MATKEKEQTYMEGTEPERHPEIEEQAEKVRAMCDKRMNLHEKEREERKKLGEMMKEAGLTMYLYRGFKDTAEVDEEPTVKVQKVKNSGEEE